MGHKATRYVLIYGSPTLKPSEQHRAALELARANLPRRDEDAPLFRAPWHARIFALIIALVKNEHLGWKPFQENLVVVLARHQSADQDQSDTQVEFEYFDCWLIAAEMTLLEAGFVAEDEISKHIDDIRAMVAQIRADQLSHHH